MIDGSDGAAVTGAAVTGAAVTGAAVTGGFVVPEGEELGTDVGGIETLHLITFPATSPKYKKAPSALCANSAKMGELDAKASQFWIPVATS